MGNLALQFFVQLAFELANLTASYTSDVNMVARAVALVKVAIAPQVKKVELVNQSLALEQIECAIDGDTRDARINFLSALEDFISVEVPSGGFHYLQKYSPLARETNSARTKLVLKPSGGFVIDALPGGYAVCGRG